MMKTNLDDMTYAELASEAERLREAGFSLTDMDEPERCTSESVRGYFHHHRPRGWSYVWRLTNPAGRRFALFADGGSEVVALVSLNGVQGRQHNQDNYAAAVLASQQ